MFSRPGVVEMKPGPQFQDRRDAAARDHRPAARIERAGDDAQQRTLAGAVPAQQTDHGSGLNIKTDVVERHEFAVVRRPVKYLGNHFAGVRINSIRLTQVADGNEEVGHNAFPNTGRSIRKVRYPRQKDSTGQ